MDLPFSVKPDTEDLGPGRHGHDPGPQLRHALRPRPGHPRRAVQEPQLLPRHPGHQPRPGRVLDHHPVPGPACPTRSAASSGSPSAPRTPPATCRSTPGMTEIPKSFTVGDHWTFDRDSVRWAFDYTDFHVQVGLLRGHQGRPGGPGDVRSRAHPAHPRDRPAGPGPVQEETGQGRRVPDRLRPQQRDDRDQRLVEAGRRPARQVQPALSLRRREAQHDRGQPATPDWWKRAVRAFDILMEPDKK
ncbi:MAG: hypothetical protein M0C28_39210 [Candidatus Moduliflexus flocculans]|nr:hypothetical protein [Candidatus Moduliflexus flocculans]